MSLCPPSASELRNPNGPWCDVLMHNQTVEMQREVPRGGFCSFAFPDLEHPPVRKGGDLRPWPACLNETVVKPISTINMGHVGHCTPVPHCHYDSLGVGSNLRLYGAPISRRVSRVTAQVCHACGRKPIRQSHSGDAQKLVMAPVLRVLMESFRPSTPPNLRGFRACTCTSASCGPRNTLGEHKVRHRDVDISSGRRLTAVIHFKSR